CSWHHLAADGLLVFWPAEYRDWARGQGLPDAARADPAAQDSRRPRADRAAPARFAIVNPPTGATYSIDPTLRRQFQTLPLRSSGAAGGQVEWSIDGRPIGNARADAPLMWPLAPGAHRVGARDPGGRTAEVGIVVK